MRNMRQDLDGWRFFHVTCMRSSESSVMLSLELSVQFPGLTMMDAELPLLRFSQVEFQ